MRDRAHRSRPLEREALPKHAEPDLVAADGQGLRCTRGGLWIDPWKPVDLAVITHAHADHASGGSDRYIATPATADLLRVRLGRNVPVEPLEFGEPRRFGEVTLTLFPAGHVLGSAQVRLETDDGPTWVVGGDFTPTPGAAAEPFEAVACDVFITESTFGLPVFSWRPEAAVFDEMNAWWRQNAEHGRTSVVYAYSLGKAQRVLAGLDPSVGAIGVHGSVVPLSDVYREHGVPLPDTVKADASTADRLKGTGIVVAPPSASHPSWLRRFEGPGGLRRAMASGWMTIRGRRRWRALDTGFVLSDHADWAGLLDVVERTGAKRIGVTHGYTRALARYLREQRGLDAFEVATRFVGEGGGEDGDDKESSAADDPPADTAEGSAP